jgi:NADH-quinone oxidoreductase subunit C
MAQRVLDALTKKFSDAIERTETAHGDEVAYVKRERLIEVVTWLRDDPAMRFDSPVFCTAIDRLGAPANDDAPRFEVCYQLRSFEHRHRLRLKVRLAEDDVKCPSLSGLYPAFNWQERETYDMYGIDFVGHPDQRRSYMYEEFIGYPLRKDYPKEKRQPLVRRPDLPTST